MIRYFIRQYWRYIAMGLAMMTISYFIGACDVKAQSLGIDLYINNTYMNGHNKLYNSGAQNVTIQLRQPSDWPADASMYNYGYIAICNATGANNPVNTISSNSFIQDFQVYTSNESCTIPTTNSYVDTARVMYITYRIDRGQLYVCDTYDSYECIWTQNITFTIYQPNSTEYSLVGLGFSNSSYMVNSEANLNKAILNSIYQQIATTNGNIVTLNTKLDSVNSNIAITNAKLDTALSHLVTINGNIVSIRDKLDILIEQNQVCNYIDKDNIKDDNKTLLWETGQFTDRTTTGVTDYIKISKSVKIKRLVNLPWSDNFGICFYTINKTLITCYQATATGDNITIPNNSSYVRFTIYKSRNEPQYEICDTSQNIQNNQNEQIIQGQNEINSNITDSSTDDPSGDISDMNQNEISNSVISDLLLLPINMFQNILNAVNGTCSSFSLGALFGTNLVLPCINLQNLLGSTLWGVIDVLFCGIFVLSMRKKFVDIFENITSLKDRGNELE